MEKNKAGLGNLPCIKEMKFKVLIYRKSFGSPPNSTVDMLEEVCI